MGYALRLKLASFSAGAAVASAFGLYFMHHDYILVHQSMSQQINEEYKALDRHVSSLENSKREVTKQVETSDKT
ncbi:unnamed protein product [Lactuca virosa]|uniref:Uncharacterized protein n=1 Tax=Lactuca virosa TaxID=75947 RepID=A0AAU9P0L1_9ASTR|nr:unnamed protein product [Lactuca virosa]